MRTLIVIGIGFALWLLSLAAAKFLGGWSPTAKSISTYIFIAVWFIATAYNVSIGVSKGYTVMQELPIFLITFLLPAAVAIFIRLKYLQ